MRKIAADKNYYIIKRMISKKAVQLSGYYTGLKKHNWQGRLVIGCTEGDDTEYCNEYRRRFKNFAEAWLQEDNYSFWNIMGPLQDTSSGEFSSWFNSLFQDWWDSDMEKAISGSDVHDKFVGLFPNKEGSLSQWLDDASMIDKVLDNPTEKSSWGMACERLADAFNG